MREPNAFDIRNACVMFELVIDYCTALVVLYMETVFICDLLNKDAFTLI